MKVLIPSALRSYTQNSHAEANGATLDAVLADLDRQYPGIRFRVIDEQRQVRRHIRIFVNGVSVEVLAQTMRPDDEIVIVQALSGG
jgi:molybdopterin converting factor small subunit